MNANVEQTRTAGLNPILSISFDGTVLYSNEASEPILSTWGVRVGEMLPSNIICHVQSVITQNNPEKIEIKVGNKEYLVVFHPLPEQKCVIISGFDISYQTNLERKLRESEENLDEVQKMAHIGNWKWNIITGKLFWSDEVYRILGFKPQAFEATFDAFLKNVHPEDRDYLNNAIKKAFEGEPYSFDNRIITSDGKERIVHTDADIIFNKDNKPVYARGIIQDITECRQAEHQLSNELARATGLYELYTRSSNLSDCELYGFALNQVVKITDSMIGFFHLVSEDEKEIILTTWNQEALRSCTAGKEGHYPIEKAGNWVDCVRLKRPVVYNDFSSSPNQKGLPVGHSTVKRFMSVPVIENGKVRIIFGVGNKVHEYDNRDVMQLQLVANELHKIMKLRRIENEIRESEAFLQDIMKNVSEAIFVTDKEARMILANPAYYRLMGKSPEEVLNKTVADIYPPEVAKKLAEVDKKVIETGKGTTLEKRIFTLNGWRILQTIKTPYYDRQGDIIGMIGAARDITERKQAEEGLKKAHDNLEKLVKERTEELEKAYNLLKESEEKYRIIVETANEGIAITVYNDIIKYANKKFADMLGYTLEEVIGRPAWEFFSEESKVKIKMNNEERWLGINDSYELKLVCKDGSPIWTYINSKSLFDKEHKYMGSVSMLTDISERKKAEEALANIETVRKQEIHHRIKNNLQVISSLLDLQAETFKGKKNIEDSQVLEAFKESQDRVISMALIHEELHKGGETDTLNFSHYVEELTANLFLTYRIADNGIFLSMEIEEDVFFDIDTSVPLGIIINELISNSLKYAFIDRDYGEIHIKLKRENRGEYTIGGSKYTTFILSVSDNGVGIPKNLDIEYLGSLGLQLVTTLVDQLDGELELIRDKGTEFIIRFMISENDNLPSEPSSYFREIN